MLVDILRSIEASDDIPSSMYLSSFDHPLLEEAELIADGELITVQGRPNWDAIAVLERQGFKVTRGEHDSFGWLSGVIHTAKGKLIFG